MKPNSARTFARAVTSSSRAGFATSSPASVSRTSALLSGRTARAGNSISSGSELNWKARSRAAAVSPALRDLLPRRAPPSPLFGTLPGGPVLAFFAFVLTLSRNSSQQRLSLRPSSSTRLRIRSSWTHRTPARWRQGRLAGGGSSPWRRWPSTGVRSLAGPSWTERSGT